MKKKQCSCGTILSMYNEKDLCFACQEKKEGIRSDSKLSSCCNSFIPFGLFKAQLDYYGKWYKEIYFVPTFCLNKIKPLKF
jgi:hypothetical protein